MQQSDSGQSGVAIEPVPAQHWQADGYARNARFVADLGLPVFELLAPRPGERILDLGCGDGALTAKIQAAGCRVLGVDASADMVDAARRLGLDVRVGDGEALDFEGEFDAVFSNAALHWMRRPEKVVAGVRRALKPGGRFVGEFGGFGNVAAARTALYAVVARHGIDAAAVDPWYFPDPQSYGRLLTAQGFRLRDIRLVPRPTPLPTGIDGWLETFAGSFLHALPPAARAAAQQEVVALLRPVLCTAAGDWVADYVRLRFAADLSV